MKINWDQLAKDYQAMLEHQQYTIKHFEHLKQFMKMWLDWTLTFGLREYDLDEA